jgi:hypothetical protein
MPHERSLLHAGSLLGLQQLVFGYGWDATKTRFIPQRAFQPKLQENNIVRGSEVNSFSYRFDLAF